MIKIRIDAFPDDADLRALLVTAWPDQAGRSYANVLRASLAHVCAYDSGRLIGFVNVAWDGGLHASIFDTCVEPSHRGRGLGAQLVGAAAAVARKRGALWLHVDFEAALAPFYAVCGFAETAAGLLGLTRMDIGDSIGP